MLANNNEAIINKLAKTALKQIRSNMQFCFSQ